jgi:hypothetical protein
VGIARAHGHGDFDREVQSLDHLRGMVGPGFEAQPVLTGLQNWITVRQKIGATAVCVGLAGAYQFPLAGWGGKLQMHHHPASGPAECDIQYMG